ncbi:hypothetical protein NDU88_005164 [Pleurodeles waltl]|uniref:Uncharacterized protein n=1 Tax=Pleurodeles waltl TaxID=8319 RepID=A0AAV7T9T2_PLEWA|nr:hypothetical protein NDU88_005164 [Pleurodeles waltl]
MIVDYILITSLNESRVLEEYSRRGRVWELPSCSASVRDLESNMWQQDALLKLTSLPAKYSSFMVLQPPDKAQHRAASLATPLRAPTRCTLNGQLSPPSPPDTATGGRLGEWIISCLQARWIGKRAPLPGEVPQRGWLPAHVRSSVLQLSWKKGNSFPPTATEGGSVQPPDVQLSA